MRGRGAARLLAAGLLVLSAVSCGRTRNRTLNVLWTSEVLSLDPNERFESHTDIYAMNVFEPLVKVGRQASLVPVLATRWDLVGAKTWRFTILRGVTFHDGSPLTGDDVVFTVKRVLAHPESDLYPYLSSVTEVKTAGPDVVELTSERPAGVLLGLSSVYILPRKLVEAQGDKAFFQHPVGSGPYVFTEWKPNELLVLSRWTGYREVRGDVARAEFHHATTSAEMWTKARDLPAFVVLGPSRKTWNERKSDPKVRLLSRLGMSVQYLVCRTTGGDANPLSKRDVRHALRAAIDVRKLIEVVGGQAFPASQLVTPDIVGFDPTIPVPEFRPGVAKSLLERAGYGNGLSLRLVTQTGSDAFYTELLQQLSTAGIRVTRETTTAEDSFRRLAGCDADLFETGWICATGDAAELLEGNFSGDKKGRPIVGCGFTDKALDERIAQVARTTDPRTRRDLLQQAMRLLEQELPFIPLMISYDLYGTSPDVSFDPRPDGELFLLDVTVR